MNRPTNSAVLLIAAAMTLVSAEALACGESLFRVGKGVAYRAYSAPLPANVLVYVETEEQRELATRLASAGHAVRTVANADALFAELSQADVDVVIAPPSQREIVASASKASFLPLVTAGSEEERTARGTFPNSIVTDQSLKEQLRAIHRSLKAS